MSKYHVQRATEIEASPEKVFETLADYRTWTTWSPWLCAEPDAAVQVSEDSSSVGSVYSWQGELVGHGELQHRELRPGQLVDDEIRFIKPFRSQAQVTFEIAPCNGGSRVIWHMRGELPWFLFWMKRQIETYVDIDYERGLKMLKEWIETGQILSKTRIRGVEPVGPLHVLGVRNSCTMDDVGASMQAAFQEADEQFRTCHLPRDGMAISVYHEFDFKDRHCEYTSGFSIPETETDVPPGLAGWSLPATQAICVEHVGNYEHLGNAWSSAYQYARYKKLKLAKGGCYEVYKNDPHQTPTAELITEVVVPLK